ncbi:MAG: pyridoxamine 5'-phosphate oxidase family protein [Sneathiella sp.]
MSDTETVISLKQLEEIYGPVNPNSLAKEVTSLNETYRKWLEKSPFFAIASGSSQGFDCSPRGDKKGQLFRVLDNNTLAIPDRRGNNRIDTLKNIVENPRVGLMFMLPGINETLRINGDAHLTTNAALLESFAVDGKAPTTVILVTITAVYFQCARALIRSELWNPVFFSHKSDVPTAGQMTKSALADFDDAQYDAELPNRQKSTLY